VTISSRIYTDIYSGFAQLKEFGFAPLLLKVNKKYIPQCSFILMWHNNSNDSKAMVQKFGLVLVENSG
jgi:hypothetical protein